MPDMAEDGGIGSNRVLQSDYSMHAFDIGLISCAPEKAPSDGSTLLLDAQGGKGQKNGNLFLHSTGTAIMLCGTSLVGIKSDSPAEEVHLECNETGKIVIHQSAPVVSPTITLKPDGITLTVGPDPAGSKIEMTAQGITLQCGPTAKIEMTAQGIKLSVAGMNSVELKPSEVDVKGLMVKLNGQLQTEVQGGIQTTIKAGAMLQTQAALTMIG